MTKLTILLVLLSISVSLNMYLFFDRERVRETWVNQAVTTLEVEIILKEAATDIGFENIRAIAIQIFDKDRVHIIDLEDKSSDFGSDKLALAVNDTLILFKDGLYYFSQTNIRDY